MLPTVQVVPDIHHTPWPPPQKKTPPLKKKIKIKIKNKKINKINVKIAKMFEEELFARTHVSKYLI